MLQASADTRQRFWLLLVPVIAVLGMWSLWGLYEQWTSRTSEVAPSPSMGDIRSERRLSRGLETALTLLGRHGDWNGVVQTVDTIGEEDLLGRLRLFRAEALLRTGQRQRAAEEYQAVLGNPSPVMDADWLAIRGDRPGYVAHCNKLLNRVRGGTKDAFVGNNIAWSCVLLSGAFPDYTLPISLARAASDAPTTRRTPGDRSTYLNTLGAVLYRAGRYPEAIQRLMDSEQLRVEPFNWPFLAMAYQKQGDTARARYWANRLRQHLDSTFGQFSGQNSRPELVLFLREMNEIVPS